MKTYLKENGKFLLFVLIGGLVGGYCTGLYIPGTYSEEMLQQLQEQNVTAQMLAVIGAVQYGVVYGLVLAAIGVVLSKKTGLWKGLGFDGRGAAAAAAVAVFAGLLLFPGDKLIFGRYSSWVSDQYTAAPGLAKIVAGLLVGGIIEEVMMRLFLMSLFALILWKLFCRKEETVPTWVLVTANVFSALLFAAGHLPGTMAMTALTPVILVRCFLLNGGFGLCFGYLYRKYGIAYAMAAHGLAHLIADTLMILFV